MIKEKTQNTMVSVKTYPLELKKIIVSTNRDVPASEPHKCPYCSEMISSRRKLYTHCKQLHMKQEDTPFTCRLCKRQFGSSAEMHNHVESSHHREEAQKANKMKKARIGNQPYMYEPAGAKNNGGNGTVDKVVKSEALSFSYWKDIAWSLFESILNNTVNRGNNAADNGKSNIQPIQADFLLPKKKTRQADKPLKPKPKSSPKKFWTAPTKMEFQDAEIKEQKWEFTTAFWGVVGAMILIWLAMSPSGLFVMFLCIAFKFIYLTPKK